MRQTNDIQPSKLRLHRAQTPVYLSWRKTYNSRLSITFRINADELRDRRALYFYQLFNAAL